MVEFKKVSPKTGHRECLNITVQEARVQVAQALEEKLKVVQDGHNITSPEQVSETAEKISAFPAVGGG